MKAFIFIIIGFFCLLPVYGQEYPTYEDWLRIEHTQPFQSEPFQSESFQPDSYFANIFQAMMSSTSDDDWTELGGLERPLGIEDGTPFLLLLSLAYCVRCHRSHAKHKSKSKKSKGLSGK